MTDRFFYLKIKQAGRIQRPLQTKQGGRAAATTCRGPTGVAAIRNAGAPGRVTIHRDRAIIPDTCPFKH